MRLLNTLLQQELDKISAILGIIFSVTIFIFGGLILTQVLYIFMGGLITISCFLWLAIRNNHPYKYYFPISQTLSLSLGICFFGLYTLSILVMQFCSNLYERPLLYFILMALMVGIIACEIFTSGKQYAALIFIQILIIGISIAWSQLLNFPSLLGIDPWFHSAFTGSIIKGGYVPDGYAYSKLPLFHIVIATTSLVTGLSYKFATMASGGLVQIICNSLLIFLIAKNLFANHRVGLIASLLVITSNYHIQMSIFSIPNAFAAVYIPISLYVLLFKLRNSSRPTFVLLLIMVMYPIILTHTITTVCMAIILFVIWAAFVFYRGFYSKNENGISLFVPISFTIAMLAWWTHASNTLGTLIELFRSGFNIDFFVKTPEELHIYKTYIPLHELLFNNLGIFLCFALSFVGVLYMISRKGSSSSFAMAWVGITPLAVAFFSLISGHGVIEERWFYFAQILLSIPLASAIYLMGTWKLKKPINNYCLIFIFFVVLTIFMIMSADANVDNHMFSPITGTTTAYTQSEMIATDFFAQKTIGTISSDYHYCTCPSSSVFIHAYGIMPERLLTLDDSLVSGIFHHDGSLKIVRSKWRKETLKRGKIALRIRPDIDDYLSNSAFSKIYDSPAMTGFFG